MQLEELCESSKAVRWLLQLIELLKRLLNLGHRSHKSEHHQPVLSAIYKDIRGLYVDNDKVSFY